MERISFTAKLYNKPLENDMYPIVLLISWRGNKSESRRKRLGIACYKEDWDDRNNRIKSEVWGAMKSNQVISKALEKAGNIYKNHFENKAWNFTEWAELFEGENEKVTFTSWAKQLIKEYNNRGQSGTADHYRDAQKSIQNFLKKKEVQFEEITDTLLGDFERYQISRGYIGRRNFVGLKVIIGTAVKRRIIPMDLMPFYCGYNPTGYSFSHLDKIKLPKKDKSKWIKRLGKDTQKVLAYVPQTSSCERDMDLWKFSYYTMGTDLKDIALMQFSHIDAGLWFYNREKTGEGGLGKPLIKEAMDIVLKYYDPKNKYVFNWIMENGKYDINNRTTRDRIMLIVNNLRRRYMQISKELELGGHFSWRTARYTSASNAVNRGGNVKDVQVLMDHSSVTTTERYAKYANHQKMQETLELLRCIPPLHLTCFFAFST